MPQREAKRRHRRSKSWHTKLVPMFPGYLFLAEGVTNWRGVFAVDGVLGVLEGAKGGKSFYPASIPQDTLEQLQMQPMDLDDEFPQFLFTEGELVRIVEGPFTGYLGEVTGVKREDITLELVPRCNKIPVVVNATILVKNGKEKQPRK